MTNCKKCGTYQSRLRRGGFCDNCSNAQQNNSNRGPSVSAPFNMNNSRMSTPNMIPNMQGGAMNFPSEIPGSASSYLSYSNPRISMNPPVMSSTNNQMNVQQQNQRFDHPQNEGFSHVITSHSNDIQANNTMMNRSLNERQDPTIQQLLNKPSNNLSAADIFQIIQLANRDIHTKIDNLAQDVNTVELFKIKFIFSRKKIRRKMKI